MSEIFIQQTSNAMETILLRQEVKTVTTISDTNQHITTIKHTNRTITFV